MAQYKLSYVLTTYNKLPYLRQVLGRLLAERQPDEEIVVCDGGSNDGTSAYLQELYEAGQIQQFVSERDKGEAHGFNKGFLRAKGEFVKIITDDDAYYYPVIRQAANYMLQHPTVDVMLGYNATTQLEDLALCRYS
ncbi:MAG: glycosyltransferase [Hymenobacter sp.]